jgi:probable phosphoglycerate mutase
MELLFVRHAEPAWDNDGSTVDDPGLTDLGRKQAQALAERFREAPIDELVVSPLVRARETADALADGLGLEPVVEDWLAEIASPAWEGTPSEQVQRIFREQRAKSVEELWDGLPGGESFRDFHRRIASGTELFMKRRGVVQVAQEPPLWDIETRDRRVVIVAHAGTNATAIGWLLGIPPVPWEWERFVSLHSSVSTLVPVEIGGAHAYSLSRFGNVDHFPPALHTGMP